jgi:hypothetical protein
MAAATHDDGRTKRVARRIVCSARKNRLRYSPDVSRISNSFDLAKASWAVLKADKELIALPIISGLASIVVALSFLVPLFLVDDMSVSGEMGPLEYILLFAMYVVLAYVTIFFNAALVHAAHERLGGGDPTLRSALRGARARAGKILPWAIVSATVSVLLRALEERVGLLGRIVVGLVGMAWSLVTFLVLPLIVIEGVGIGDALGRSKDLFKRTWGENVAAQVGFGLLGFLAVLPGIAIIVLGAAAGGAVAGVGILVGVIAVVVAVAAVASMSVIFQTALYHFAVDGSVPSGYFSDAEMRAAFTSPIR